MEMIFHSRPWIMPEDIENVVRIIESRMISQGDVVKSFERSLADYLGTEDFVTCDCGTSALIMALKVLNIGPGDEVIISPYTCRQELEPVSSGVVICYV